jgi:uncharacterized protein YbjQ (UPF0145 family)
MSYRHSGRRAETRLARRAFAAFSTKSSPGAKKTDSARWQRRIGERAPSSRLAARGLGDYRTGMLISTMNDLPGYEVTEVLGEVFGLTVRSRNAFSQMGSSLKSMFGGELKGMTQALTDSRNQVIERMVEEAQTKGAEAILAMRFDTSEMGPNWTEICAYGTAVKVRKI